MTKKKKRYCGICGIRETHKRRIVMDVQVTEVPACYSCLSELGFIMSHTPESVQESEALDDMLSEVM